MKELQLKEKLGATIIAIIMGEKVITMGPEDEIQEGDTVVVIGNRKSLDTLDESDFFYQKTSRNLTVIVFHCFQNDLPFNLAMSYYSLNFKTPVVAPPQVLFSLVAPSFPESLISLKYLYCAHLSLMRLR